MHDELKRFQELLHREILSSLPSDDCELVQAMRYAMENPGKMLRPLLAYALAGAPVDKTQEFLTIGTSIECLHTFTLIHDDIMDSSLWRRGRPSVYCRWGINLAILAGDALLAHALHLLLHAENNQTYLKLVAKTLPDVSRGQGLDLAPVIDIEKALDEYLQMAAEKTGALFGLAATLGAVAGGYDLQQQEVARQLGVELGIAYQMRDDYAEIFSAVRHRETTAMDLKLRRRSLLVLLGLKYAPQQFEEILNLATNDPQGSLSRAAEILAACGAQEEAKQTLLNSKRNCSARAQQLPQPGPLLREFIEEILSLPHNP